jgi:hypothetical protein
VSVLLALALVTSGFHGVVTRGPTTPVCRVGKPCSAPAVGALLLFERNGRVAARVKTRARGAYSVRLRPGYYLVRIAPAPRLGKSIRPYRVHVRSGVFRRLDFSIDTGIR